MNEETKQAIRNSAQALHGIDLPDGDLDAVLPAVEQNTAIVSRLVSRIAFEDEPSLYVDVLERARG